MAQPHAPERTASGYPRMTYEEFLALPDDLHAEWVDGEVCVIPSVSSEHNRVTSFLIRLIGAQVEGTAEVLHEPFQMKTGPDLPGRAPDVFVLLNEHMDQLRSNYLDGPADLVIEVLSPSGERRDRGDKFYEYQEGGVVDYWLIDPIRQQAEFWARDARGLFVPLLPEDGVLRSCAVPAVVIRVSWFWDRPLVRDALAELAAI